MLCILRGLSRCVGVEKCRGSWKYDRSVLCSRQVRSGAEDSYSYAKNCWLGGWLIGCAGIWILRRMLEETCLVIVFLLRRHAQVGAWRMNDDCDAR